MNPDVKDAEQYCSLRGERGEGAGVGKVSPWPNPPYAPSTKAAIRSTVAHATPDAFLEAIGP